MYEEDEEEDPTILVSTYHVAELVSAVAGDTLGVEIISPSNIPVHDYEPSAADIAKMIDSEMFFYHGLNLEPWVDTTLEALGDDAPIAVMTHTMPTGQDTLDYESVLISNLCEVLTEGPFESTTLVPCPMTMMITMTMTMTTHDDDETTQMRRATMMMITMTTQMRKATMMMTTMTTQMRKATMMITMTMKDTNMQKQRRLSRIQQIVQLTQ